MRHCCRFSVDPEFCSSKTDVGVQRILNFVLSILNFGFACPKSGIEVVLNACFRPAKRAVAGEPVRTRLADLTASRAIAIKVTAVERCLKNR